MRKSYVMGALCCTLILAALVIAGCTQNAAPAPATPAATAVPVATTPVASVPAATAISTTSSIVQTMTPTPTTSGNSATTIPVNSSSNGDILTIPASNQVLVTLAENPTTGYQWNATVSKGLSVVSDTYVAPNSSLIGAGGYHEWLLAPDTVGTYTFQAVYMRSWEGPSSAANTFSIVIEATSK
ncbi:secreted protein-like protein [Methanoregula boonei 6A8]|uniref:Secreted protein-like protein n=1 Tax=Methanoregula boonei (strain DSM 21154 / JCM 14090 / 6A8) TaxID=456442 RepID=A7IA61_METB6|nr:protease inhibitor I42 family protein [Methanoregula boonei]ABS56622.1 secreted protein-like protein [Methanoregula boonei 6A8]